MAAPFVLGGITVPLHAGVPDVTYEPVGGKTDVRLTSGALVRMRRWSRTRITITGDGWMATGLDALNWDNQHLLLSPKPQRVATPGGAVQLTSTPRPDQPVFAHALVGEHWVKTGVTLNGLQATPTPVPGATTYSIGWYPQFIVLCEPPPEASRSGGVSWTLVCNEV